MESIRAFRTSIYVFSVSPNVLPLFRPIVFACLFFAGSKLLGETKHGLLWHHGHRRPGVGGGDVDRHAYGDREDFRRSAGEFPRNVAALSTVVAMFVQALLQVLACVSLLIVVGGTGLVVVFAVAVAIAIAIAVAVNVVGESGNGGCTSYTTQVLRICFRVRKYDTATVWHDGACMSSAVEHFDKTMRH